MQRPLFAFSLSLDLKSRAFWFFIFTDEKGTPVKIGTAYSLCLKDKVEGKNKAGRDILAGRPRTGEIFLSDDHVGPFCVRRRRGPARRRDSRARATPFVYICTKQISTHSMKCRRKGEERVCRSGERSARFEERQRRKEKVRRHRRRRRERGGNTNNPSRNRRLMTTNSVEILCLPFSLSLYLSLCISLSLYISLSLSRRATFPQFSGDRLYVVSHVSLASRSRYVRIYTIM